MTAAQISLLRKIDELRRYNNLEAAETWEDVYARLYGTRPHRRLCKPGGLSRAGLGSPGLRHNRTG